MLVIVLLTIDIVLCLHHLSPAYVLATMPVYDPTELSRANWVATVQRSASAGSILDISKYRDTCERSISIFGGIAILRYIEYRMNQSDDTWAIYKYRVSNEISSIV